MRTLQGPHGPRTITAARQVTLPDEVMQAAGLSTGDKVYFSPHDYPPGSILITPLEHVISALEEKRARDASAKRSRKKS